MDINEYVEQLPEIYQRIYKHPEYDQSSRLCEDRERYIVECVTSLQQKIGKKNLKVLDLGCAQGYFSLTLKNLGCEVTGIDFCKENIDLCRALSEENNFDCNFKVDIISDELVNSLYNDEYDVVLFLSVVHHICNANGFEYARNLFSALADKSQIVITELAVKAEALYWSNNLPSQYEEWFTKVKFFNELAMCPTHLSNIERPLIIYSNRLVFCNNKYYEFNEYKTKSYDLKSEDKFRRYFLSDEYLVKYCRSESEVFCKELKNEIEFIQNNQEISFLPKIISYELDPNVLCVYKIEKGQLLLDLIKNKEKFDLNKVFLDILDNLINLEKAGYYHGDIRLWNVCIKNNVAFLIDFGNIQKYKIDEVAKQFNKDFNYTVYDALIALLYDSLTCRNYSSIQQSSYYCLKTFIQDDSIDVKYITFFKKYLLCSEQELSYEVIKNLFLKYIVNRTEVKFTIEENEFILQQQVIRGLSEKVNKEDFENKFAFLNNEFLSLNNTKARIDSNLERIDSNVERIDSNLERIDSNVERINNNTKLSAEEIDNLKHFINEQSKTISILEEKMEQQNNYINQVHKLLLFTKNRTLYGFCAFLFRKLFRRK